MTAPLVTRRASLDDLEVLLGFQQAMALETEGKRLEDDRVRAGLSAILEDAGRGTYLIAERAGQPLGCTMWTVEWSDWRNGWFWWIQSVYVEPAFRGQGVYRALHQEVRKQAARRPDICGLRLYVEQSNARAQQTYRSVGMDDTGYLVFEE